MSIDLNADVGESFGPYTLGDDEGMLACVTSANVACGFHAGDPGVMRRTVALAARLGVAVGAHVGYPDRQGFGRRVLLASPEEVYDDTLYQAGALWGFLRAAGLALHHVKPHGALYNHMAREEATARAVARAVRDLEPELPLVALAGSAGAAAARAEGAVVVEELFADRGYEPDGSLLPRSSPGALVTEPAVVAARAVEMALHSRVKVEGGSLELRGGTICLHGDTPGAAGLARAVRAALEATGVAVRAF